MSTNPERNNGIRPELLDSAVPIESVFPHPRNVRRGNMEALKASLIAHGQYKPITVQATTPEGEPRNFVVAGNHTWRGASELGWDEIAVSYIVCSDEDALRILLVDNRTNDLASYDDPELVKLLEEMSHTELSFEGTGFSFDDYEDLAALMAKDDTVAGGNTPQERTQSYERAGIRSIVLPYSIVDHERVVKALTALRFSLGVDSFADVVLNLAERAIEPATTAVADPVDA